MLKPIFISAFLIAPSVAAACQLPPFTPLQDQAIPIKPDQTRFSKAVLVAVNYARCLQNRAPLSENSRARKAALIHSINMARSKTFSHQLSIRNAKTVKDRAKTAHLRWRWLAENIALMPRYAFKNKIPFQVIDRTSCSFASPATGHPIPVHTYASLAQTTVANWLASPGHRKNILSNRARKTATALVFDPTGAPCGRFYITQVFAD